MKVLSKYILTTGTTMYAVLRTVAVLAGLVSLSMIAVQTTGYMEKLALPQYIGPMTFAGSCLTTLLLITAIADIENKKEHATHLGWTLAGFQTMTLLWVLNQRVL